MSPSLPPDCLPFPWVLDLARLDNCSSVVVRSVTDLERVVDQEDLTKLRLRALATLSEDHSTLVARTDATRDVVISAVRTSVFLIEDSYLDLRLGQFELVMHLAASSGAVPARE